MKAAATSAIAIIALAFFSACSASDSSDESDDSTASRTPSADPEIPEIGDSIQFAEGAVEVTVREVLPAEAIDTYGGTDHYAPVHVEACLVGDLPSGQTFDADPSQWSTRLTAADDAEADPPEESTPDSDDQMIDQEPEYPETVKFNSSTPEGTCAKGWLGLGLAEEPFDPISGHSSEHYYVVLAAGESSRPDGSYQGWRIAEDDLGDADTDIPKLYDSAPTVGDTTDNGNSFPVTLLSVDRPKKNTYQAELRVCHLYDALHETFTFGRVVARAADGEEGHKSPGTVLTEGRVVEEFAEDGDCRQGTIAFDITSELPDDGFWITRDEDNDDPDEELGWIAGADFWIPAD